jgi:hypothetical protein
MSLQWRGLLRGELCGAAWAPALPLCVSPVYAAAGVPCKARDMEPPSARGVRGEDVGNQMLATAASMHRIRRFAEVHYSHVMQSPVR